jgi:cell division protein FtsQ
VSLGGQQAERFDDYGLGLGRVLTAVLFILAVLGCVWIYLGVTKMDRWPIRWLEVDGAFERVSAEQLRKQVAPLIKGSFFTVDAAAISASARELNWVSRVSVQKTWPDTVEVIIEEYVPVAHWLDDQLIGSNREAFVVPGAAEMQGLPWLEGPEGAAQDVIDQWLVFNDELASTGLVIDHIRLDRRGAWDLRLNNGTQVQIGREAPLARLQRMVSSWPQLLTLNNNNMAPLGIDLRYSNGFAVRWPEPPPEMADNRR